jgi:hypothetical protein
MAGALNFTVGCRLARRLLAEQLTNDRSMGRLKPELVSGSGRGPAPLEVFPFHHSSRGSVVGSLAEKRFETV